MPFWAWALTYVAAWMVMYRIVYLRFRDSTQRWVAAGKHRDVVKSNEYGHKYKLTPDEALENQRTKDTLLSLLLATSWPFVLLYLGLWALGKAGHFIMFPRGIRTKFDREQELKRKLAEETKALEAAKELLRQEGVKT